MKKFIVLILAFLIIFSSMPVQAASIIVSKNIPTISGVALTGTALVTGSSPYFTDGIDNRNNRGFSSLIVASTASITITQQVSDDGVTFYDPVDSNGTALGAIATALATNAWIVYTARMANFIRFKIVVNSNSTVSLTNLQSAEY